MKRAITLLLLLALGTGLMACNAAGSRDNPADTLGGSTFVWEKEGFGGDFTITLQKDGTYEYYTGFLSSYIGMGNWSVRDGILTMKETGGYDLEFSFRVEPGELIYLSEKSDSFPSVSVQDGDRFIRKEQ